jgi:hypothetical protein
MAQMTGNYAQRSPGDNHDNANDQHPYAGQEMSRVLADRLAWGLDTLSDEDLGCHETYLRFTWLIPRIEQQIPDG